MPSEGLVYSLEENKQLTTENISSTSSNESYYGFYAEKHNGTYVKHDKLLSIGSTFICQRLHVFELKDNDVYNERWCPECHQTPRKRRKSSFYVNYNSAKDIVDINCESGHAYQLNLSEIKGFKDCPRCTPTKKSNSPVASKARSDEEDMIDSQLKNYETTFINSYKRLIEAFPLIRKLPTTNLVAVYFNKELYNLPEDLQPNSMAVHLILEHKSFVKAIFEKLNDQLRRKFFHKIAAGIHPVFSIEPRTLEAYEYVYFLSH